MADLLLELFSEEIPARMQRRAADDLKRLVTDGLREAGYTPAASTAYATPRRLTLYVTGLPVKQEDLREERKGPRVGAPDKAVEGFLKSAGLDSVEQAETREDKKGRFYVAVIDRKGRPTPDVIAEIMPKVIETFPWPKSMRWGDGALRWVRPLHRILCTFDHDVVPFTVGGIESADVTEGHRFMAPGEIQARSFEPYRAALDGAKVILDPDQREEKILADAHALASAQGLELVEDRALLSEVAGLAEFPIARIGSFDEKFLTVPDEALIASMKGHQKYFSLKDPATGRLAPRFICVANIEPEDGGASMMVGYERVLEARLSDAWFLFHQDRKIPLAQHAERLANITFFEGLGTVADKVDRVAALAREIAPHVGADPDTAEKAARLAKADLVTEMVGEFPELQGIMGRYYYIEEAAASFETPSATAPQDEAAASPHAGAAGSRGTEADTARSPHAEEARSAVSKHEGLTGEDRAIADAIRDHYKPAGQGDEVPTAPVSVALALAEKLATLALFWSIDQKPTGSKDPFALRRAALGVVQIVLGNEVRLSLSSVIGLLLPSSRTRPEESPAADPGSRRSASLGRDDDGGIGHDLLSFFHDRLTVYLRDEGHRHDHIRAVITPGADDLVLIVRRLTALEAFLKTDDGENLTAAYKRAGNILKAEEKKGALPEGEPAEGALDAPEEKALFAALTKARAAADPALEAEDFEGAMTALAGLRGPLDAFFDKVTVNAEDPALRENRLKLLRGLVSTCDRVADFSALEG